MEHYLETHGISVNIEGKGNPLVIFHGWGCNKEMFQFVTDHLKNRYTVYAFDLPGFGKSKEPEYPYGTEDYARVMEDVFKELDIKNPVGMGHSHGGRTLIKMATRVPFDKLILMGSAGVKNKRPLSYYFKVYSYKLMKRIYSFPPVRKLYPNALEQYGSKAGSEDYKNASPMMKQVLSKVVNEDLTPEFDKIKVSTLLIWGENDTATPLSDGQLMEKSFEDAGLVVFEGGSHFAFLEESNRFLTIIDAFI